MKKGVKMKWISIKDELPKNYQRVIVGRDNETNVMKILTFKDSFIDKNYWGDCIESFFAEPTHWMPLPPPPSSSNSECTK